MNILFAASEAAPFIKTGGLADVMGSLPQALAAQGHDVRVALPLYEGIHPQWRERMEFLLAGRVELAWRNQYCGVFQLVKDGVRYYFLDNEYYFKRQRIYGHYDDAERFAFLSRAVTRLPALVDWAPDILHCNDWQSALIPIYLAQERPLCPQLARTRTVFTIHNIEYQGRYSRECLEDVFGLDAGSWVQGILEYYGDVNLMKGAVYASDFVTTVSPSYAQEIQYAFYAHGLEGVLSDCAGKLRGILNGLDTALYDPARDPALPQRYTPDDLSGKAVCKRALQQAVGLAPDADAPLLGCVSRLVAHKGFDLVLSALDDILSLGVQMVVLGTGESRYEEAFRQAAQRYPGRFSAQMEYSPALSTAIYSGADLFLMPSISEPCGLSQMIAMRYGTLPIVRETGGLKDTVIPAGAPGGRGFSFANINAHDMTHVIREAVQLYRRDPARWRGLQHAAMTADFSWSASTGQYLDLYRRLVRL